MKMLVKKTKGFLRRCDGPTAVEYTVLLFLIIFGALTAISLLGANLRTSIVSTANALPLGTSEEDSDQSSQGESDDSVDEDEGEEGRGDGRGRGGGGGRGAGIVGAKPSSACRGRLAPSLRLYQPNCATSS